MRVTPLFLAIGLASALENGLARTPQMGWVCDLNIRNNEQS